MNTSIKRTLFISLLIIACGATFYTTYKIVELANFYWPPIPPTPTPPSSFFRVDMLVEERFLTQPSFSANGKLLAAQGVGHPGSVIRQLFILDLDTGQEVLSTQDKIWTSVSLSPDGRWMAASGEGISPGVSSGVYLIDSDSKMVSYLIPGSESAWSPNGQLLAVVRQTVNHPDPNRRVQIWTYDLSLETETLVFDMPSTNGWIADLAWSPNQTRIAFTMLPERPANDLHFFDLYVLSLQQGTIEKLSDGSQDIVSPNFSSDGERVLYVDRSPPLGAYGGNLRVIDLDGRCHQLNPPIPAIDRVALSPNGEKVAFDTSHGLFVAEIELALGSDFWVVGEPCS